MLQVRKTKTELNHTVPMNTRVREVLNLQPRTSEYVFKSRDRKAVGRSQERASTPLDQRQGFQTFNYEISVTVALHDFLTVVRNL